MGCAGVLSVWLVTKCRRIKFRLCFPHLMESKSFFSPLTMDRKAPCAESEGKVSCRKRLTRRLALTRLYRERECSAARLRKRRFGACITCFAGILGSGCVLPASQSKVGGEQMFRSLGSRCLWGLNPYKHTSDALYRRLRVLWPAVLAFYALAYSRLLTTFSQLAQVEKCSEKI